MQIRRTVGEKGQVVLPKDVRDYLGIKPGSEVIFEVRDKEVIVRPQKSGKEWLDDFLNVPEKLRKNITVKDIKKMLDEQYEEEYDIR